MPDAPIYRVGPQPGAPRHVPDVLSNREGPQAREPSKCLKGQSYAERLALLVTSYKRLNRDADRAMTPAAGAVGIPQAWCPNGPHKPRGRATFTLSSHWDADVTGKKLLCLCVQGRIGRVQLCDPVDCPLPGFSVRGLLRARIVEHIGPYCLPYLSRALYFLLP